MTPPLRLAMQVIALTCVASLVGCETNPTCLQDDPYALRLIPTDRVTGVRIEDISGNVISGPFIRPIQCYRHGGIQECYGWASSSRATVRVERAGYLAWDTTNVPIQHVGECNRPIPQDMAVRLVPAPTAASRRDGGRGTRQTPAGVGLYYSYPPIAHSPPGN